MGMGKNIGALILSAFFFIFFVMSLFTGYTVPNINERPTESNSVQLTATITSIEIVKENYVIRTLEYRQRMFIDKNLFDLDESKELVGQVAVFRIEQKWADQLDEMLSMPPLVALSIQGKDIITIESFNKRLDDSNFKFRMFCTIAGIIFLLISIYSLLRYKGRLNTPLLRSWEVYTFAEKDGLW
ncbi:MAG: hypothetical protein FWE97_03390 [Dehalococcoidia bacterium]|nr:hypothetical protein [Dehalococcoidia bacterium]